jgi:hypothetical protein
MEQLSKELMIAVKIERVIRSCKTPNHIKAAEIFLRAGLRAMGFHTFSPDWMWDVRSDLEGLLGAMRRLIKAEAERHA